VTQRSRPLITLIVLNTRDVLFPSLCHVFYHVCLRLVRIFSLSFFPLFNFYHRLFSFSFYLFCLVQYVFPDLSALVPFCAPTCVLALILCGPIWLLVKHPKVYTGLQQVFCPQHISTIWRKKCPRHSSLLAIRIFAFFNCFATTSPAVKSLSRIFFPVPCMTTMCIFHPLCRH